MFINKSFNEKLLIKVEKALSNLYKRYGATTFRSTYLCSGIAVNERLVKY